MALSPFTSTIVCVEIKSSFAFSYRKNIYKNKKQSHGLNIRKKQKKRVLKLSSYQSNLQFLNNVLIETHCTLKYY